MHQKALQIAKHHNNLALEAMFSIKLVEMSCKGEVPGRSCTWKKQASQSQKTLIIGHSKNRWLRVSPWIPQMEHLEHKNVPLRWRISSVRIQPWKTFQATKLLCGCIALCQINLLQFTTGLGGEKKKRKASWVVSCPDGLSGQTTWSLESSKGNWTMVILAAISRKKKN